MGNSLHKHYLQFALSIQEREVAEQLAHLLSSEKGTFTIKNVRDKVEIKQHSHLSAIITRLVQKGLLARVCRGEYRFRRVALVRYLKGSEQE